MPWTPSGGFLENDLDWTDFVKFLDGTFKSLNSQFEETDGFYDIVALDGSLLYRTTVYKSGSEPASWDQATIDANTAARTAWEGTWQAKANMTLTGNVNLVVEDESSPPVVAQGPRPKVSQYLDCSHNWADKTSWHTNAAQKTGYSCPQDTGQVYDSGVTFWIDASHFKIYREATRHSDRVAKVYDNGVEKIIAGVGETEESAGVDCSVDYVTGKITFASGYTVTGPVTADFWHVDTSLSAAKQSEFILRPPTGDLVLLERVETQFTKSVDIKDTTHFAAFTYLGYLAIQTDNTLDPAAYGTGGELEDGLSFLITDAANLHASFGTISGVADNDIVVYREDRDSGEADGFVVWFDASAESSGTAMNLLAGTSPAPTVKTWDGATWSAEGYGAPVKVEYPETRDTYPDFQSYLNDATGNYAVIPGSFVTGDRGCAHDILQIPFNWLGAKHLNDSLGVELRVWLDGGVEFGPDRTHFATATFYGQIHDAPGG
jgi:hypothetical protein